MPISPKYGRSILDAHLRYFTNHFRPLYPRRSCSVAEQGAAAAELSAIDQEWLIDNIGAGFRLTVRDFGQPSPWLEAPCFMRRFNTRVNEVVCIEIELDIEIPQLQIRQIQPQSIHLANGLILPCIVGTMRRGHIEGTVTVSITVRPCEVPVQSGDRLCFRVRVMNGQREMRLWMISPIEPPARKPSIPAICHQCKHLHGEVYRGNLLVCGMHPYGNGESCGDFESR